MADLNSDNRHRGVGLAISTLLVIAALVWWHVDIDRRKKPVYPPVPASLGSFVAWHLQAQDTLPLYHALRVPDHGSDCRGEAFASQAPGTKNTASARMLRPEATATLDRVVASLRPSPSRADIELLKANYTPLIEGNDAIAGRRAWVVRLRPNVKKRPWRQMWVDKSTTGILAYREWSYCNELRAARRAKDLGRPASLAQKPSFPQVLSPLRFHTAAPAPAPCYIPRGFRLVGVRKLTPEKTTQFVYSDGLFAISVFREFPIRPGREHKDTASVYGSEAGLVLHQTRGSAEIVVIADLPESELRRIAGGR